MDENLVIQRKPKRAGFALVVVLFALVVLTLIFTTASRNSLAHAQFLSAEAVVRDRAVARAVVLDALTRSQPPEDQLFSWDSKSYRLQPTSGLIDLNSAAPSLLDLFLENYDIDTSERTNALEKFYAWRDEGYRLLRVSDFSRVTGIEITNIKKFATVHSGRTKLSIDHAPRGLVQHLSGLETDSLEDMVALLPPEFLGTGASSTFAVFEAETNARIGVVRFGPQPSQNAVLALDSH